MLIITYGLHDEVVERLTSLGFKPYEAIDASDVLELCSLMTHNPDAAFPYQACVVSGDMDDVDTSWIQRVRNKQICLPLIMTTTLGNDFSRTRTKMLMDGADDLVFECNTKELHASILAAMRRFRYSQKISNKVEAGPIMIDLEARLIFVNGRHVRFGEIPYKLLEFLALNAGKVISKEKAMQYLYNGLSDEPDDNIVSTMICKIRKELKRVCPGSEEYIQTVWGSGLMLVTDERFFDDADVAQPLAKVS